jgi:hypothetical protein
VGEKVGPRGPISNAGIKRLISNAPSGRSARNGLTINLRSALQYNGASAACIVVMRCRSVLRIGQRGGCVAAMVATLAVPHRRDGITIVGVTSGTHAYKARVLALYVQKAVTFVDKWRSPRWHSPPAVLEDKVLLQ